MKNDNVSGWNYGSGIGCSEAKISHSRPMAMMLSQFHRRRRERELKRLTCCQSIDLQKITVSFLYWIEKSRMRVLRIVLYGVCTNTYIVHCTACAPLNYYYSNHSTFISWIYESEKWICNVKPFAISGTDESELTMYDIFRRPVVNWPKFHEWTTHQWKLFFLPNEPKTHACVWNKREVEICIQGWIY